MDGAKAMLHDIVQQVGWMSRLRKATLGVLGTLVLAGSALGVSSCSSDDGKAGPVITIGLLLPYTGSGSATASNFERAVLYAAGRINAAGGVQGRHLRVVARDTHSDVTRSQQSATELIGEGASIVLGPESAEIAPSLIKMLVDNHVVFMSPLVGAAADPQIDCQHPWFRLAPSATVLGEALAKLMFAQSVTKTAILYSAASYDQALRDALRTKFTSLGGQVALEIELDPVAQSYASAIEQTSAAGVDSVVLATLPQSAALLVNEYGAIATSRPRWFLSPLLKTELFVLNVAPDAIEGALGVAPQIFDTSTDYAQAFAARWEGDHPLEGAYFYYDAMGLIGLALQKAPIDAATNRVDASGFESAIVKAAAPPGVSVKWSEVESGIQRTAAGESIYYSGLTGPMLLDACGSRRLGQSTTWTIQGGSVKSL